MNKNILIIIIVIILIIMVGGLYSLLSRFNRGSSMTESLGQKPTKLEGKATAFGGVPPTAEKIEILKEGSGEASKTGDLVTVHYTGTLENGTKFDSSVDRGTPFQFTLGQNRVIQGWEQGVLGMKVGEKRKLTIPSELGYGVSGYPPVIPPNATLIFQVELLKID